MGKGSRYERQLVNRLQELGWRVLRAPSSGSATDEDKPDIVAGKHGTTVAIELKSGDADKLYVEKEEVEALNRWANDFGAISRLAFRWTSQGTPGDFFFEAPHRVKDVGKNHRADLEQALEKDWPTEEELAEAVA